jgi:hypothetical protein
MVSDYNNCSNENLSNSELENTKIENKNLKIELEQLKTELENTNVKFLELQIDNDMMYIEKIENERINKHYELEDEGNVSSLAKRIILENKKLHIKFDNNAIASSKLRIESNRKILENIENIKSEKINKELEIDLIKYKKTDTFNMLQRMKGFGETNEEDELIRIEIYKEQTFDPFYEMVLNDIKKINLNRCGFKFCVETPKYGEINGTKQHCFKHRLDHEIDLVNKICRSFGYFKYSSTTDYLCEICYQCILDTKVTITKEKTIQNLLEVNGFEFIHNKAFPNNYNLKYRPDFLFDCGSYFVILEVDENSHSGYDKKCEQDRMDNISIGLGLPTLFIRYNPDNKYYSRKTKHKQLLITLDDHLNMEQLEDTTPIYLFY